MSKKEVKTTGQLRMLLAEAINSVVAGDMDIETAGSVHKLAKNISDSLYSETKIRMFANEIGEEAKAMGDMPLGGS